MRKSVSCMLVLGATITACQPGEAQESTYRVGERVELQASGDHWQSCVVTDPGSQYAVMRLRCDPYDAPGYSRGGGVYNESYNSTGVRRPAQAGNPVAAAPGRAGLPRNSTGGAGTGSRATGYHVGQAVEVEASGHWVPCTISSIDQAGGLPMIRTYCPEYPALSRAAGTYIVHNNETGLRPATGRIGRAPEPVAAPVNRSPAGRGGSLPLGEYACYGSGGSIMIGLGFRLTGSSSYTDLDGASRGTYTISGTNISFRGGHLDGQTGRDIEGKGFRIGSQATCELW